MSVTSCAVAETQLVGVDKVWVLGSRLSFDWVVSSWAGGGGVWR